MCGCKNELKSNKLPVEGSMYHQFFSFSFFVLVYSCIAIYLFIYNLKKSEMKLAFSCLFSCLLFFKDHIVPYELVRVCFSCFPATTVVFCSSKKERKFEYSSTSYLQSKSVPFRDAAQHGSKSCIFDKFQNLMR